jgi:glycosyltransferase involved in cell wall biosynthesis
LPDNIVCELLKVISKNTSYSGVSVSSTETLTKKGGGASARTTPLRVIQIVENLDRGAVENWLVRTFVESRREFPTVDWTFYCVLGRPGRLDELVLEHGGKIIYSPVELSQTMAFLKHLRKTLRQGAYDILHCHHDFMSGLYLLAAWGLPIKKRLVHIHNTDEAIPTPSVLKRRLAREPLRQCCLHLADGIVGISEHVLQQFMRGRQRGPSRDQLLYYGVDTEPFRKCKPQRDAMRAELGLPSDATILLFVGRMNPQKNPTFVVEMLASILPHVPSAYAVFVGSGDLSDLVELEAQSLGVKDRIRMLGWRDDTAELMANSDLFVFPRLEHPKEGLGLVVVEAQAAGLPMLVSPGIPDDAVVVSDLVDVLPLEVGPVAWAQRAVSILQKLPDRKGALAHVANSHFALRHGTKNLMRLYDVATSTQEELVA